MKACKCTGKKSLFFSILCIILILGTVNCDKIKGFFKRSGKKVENENERERNTVVAYLNGDPVYYRDIEEIVRMSLNRLEERVYQTKLQAVNQYIDDTILDKEAKKDNVTKEAFLEKELSTSIKINEKEVNEFYEKFKDRLQGTEEEKKERLRSIFRRRSMQEAQHDFLQKIKEKYDIKITLPMPEPPLVEGITVDDDPYLGDKDATVTIIEFSDYTCGQCKQASEVMKEIHKEYGDKVKIVYRDFPRNPTAQTMAEAAGCANEQGKFWEYHDKLFFESTKQDRNELLSLAKSVAIKDPKQFESCLDTRKYKDEVEKDRNDGTKTGMMSTPGYVINNRFVAGPKPLDYFKGLVDRYLNGGDNV